MHEAVTITQDTTYGLGLVASGGIPKGSDLIVLPEHIPLKFQSEKDDEADSVLLPLSNRVPGMCSLAFPHPFSLVSLLCIKCLILVHKEAFW